MVSSGLLRRVALTRATRRNNPEDTILHQFIKFSSQSKQKPSVVALHHTNLAMLPVLWMNLLQILYGRFLL
jgi:lysophospholipid acyltransferase (LPLAT)-like uncharacterized protein